MVKAHLEEMLRSQKAFQTQRGMFLGEDKEQETKEIALLMQSEIFDLLNNIGWKPHHLAKKDVVISNVHGEMIDILKYWLILANIWKMDGNVIFNEFMRKSDTVQQRWAQDFLLNVGEDKFVCVDLDGVVCDYVGTWIRFVMRNKVEAIYDVAKYNSLDLSLFLKDSAAYPALKRQFRESGEKSNAIVYDDAKYFMEYLHKHYKTAIVSARPYKEFSRIFPDTIEWLKKNELPFDVIIFESEKREWVSQHLASVNFCVEDNGEQALKLAAFGTKVYLLDKKYNKGVKHKNIVRIETLSEIVRLEEQGEK